MSRLIQTIAHAAFALVLLAGCAHAPEHKPAIAAASSPSPAVTYAAIPKDKDNDLKLYAADGRILKGADALGRMQREAGLILWLAGNQFFAMDDVVAAFQKQHAGIAVGVITLPPGLLLRAIQTGGWTYEGRSYPGLPDVYASVNLGHLKALKKAGLMDTYATYLHNEMVLMVAQGNPKRITGIKDLVRPDVRTSLPNPVSEGIMRFYGRKVLERHGLWNRIAAGKECASCQTTPNNWFTSVHHRETPERIQDGRSDTGIVWVTETMQAKRDGAKVDSVRLPPEDSLVDEVSYAIGSMSNSRNKATADRYIRFLATAEAKLAYAKYGFVNASDAELALKPIP
jgi:ABC-type molybdate transport system substrate-binding protein